MPNWIYLFVALIYNLGLAVWIGGTVVLGALVAPTLFRRLDRQEAGGLFGAILRKFSRIRLVCLGLVICSAAFKLFYWETHITGSSSPLWISIRWAAIAVMAAGIGYEVLFVERAMDRARNGSPDPASKSLFSTLHLRAERLVKVELFAAVIALLLN